MPNPDCRPKRHGLAGYIAGALSVSRCRGIARREARGTAGQRTDAIERLRDRADALTTRAAALRRLADAEKPLYQSLDEAQKRRFDMAVRFAARRHMAANSRGGGRNHLARDSLERDGG